MDQPKTYIRIDDDGVYRVAETRVMVDSVLAGFHAGDSPESIRRQFPSLTLEAIYGSIAYYLANKLEVDAYLQRQEDLWEELRKKSEEQPSPVVARLRAMMGAKTQSQP